MSRKPILAPARLFPGVQRRRSLIALYAAAVFLFWAALYLYVPTLPLVARSRTDDLAFVGVILAQYGLWQALVRLPVGILSDWSGRRKPFIIIGFGLAALGAWLMGSSADAGGLLVGRAITGLAAATWVPLVVVFNRMFPPEDAVRATALLTFVASASRMVATGANGWLNGLGGYSLAFLLAATAACIAMLVVLPAHEEALAPRRPAPRGVLAVVARRDVWLPSALAGVSLYAAWATTFGFFPLLARQLGADDVTQSLLTSLNVAAGTIGNLLAATAVLRIGSKRLVLLSFVLLAGSTALAVPATSLAPLYVAQALGGLASGVAAPVLMGLSIQKVAEGERATAMGAHQAIYAIGMFGGPWLSGILASAIGLQAMFAVTAVGTLMLGVLGVRLMERRQHD